MESINKNENPLCQDCEHYGKEEFINGDCQQSNPWNLDYCKYKKKDDNDEK